MNSTLILDILSQNIRHPEEKSIFDQKFGDKNIDQEEHVYKKQNTKETQLTKEAGKAQNFSAGTVISNAATSILGAQAAGGVIGAGAVYTGAVEVIVPAAAAVSAEGMPRILIVNYLDIHYFQFEQKYSQLSEAQ